MNSVIRPQGVSRNQDACEVERLSIYRIAEDVSSKVVVKIKSMLPNISKPQAEVLAAFRFGIAKAKSRSLNTVALDLPFLGITDEVKTRLRRFISNPRIDMAESCENIARLASANRPRQRRPARLRPRAC